MTLKTQDPSSQLTADSSVAEPLPKTQDSLLNTYFYYSRDLLCYRISFSWIGGLQVYQRSSRSSQ